MDSELRRLERERRLLGGDDPRLERARARAGNATSLAEFIRCESNALAQDLIADLAARRAHANVFLGGPTGTGKTLLLRALAVARPDSTFVTGAELEERATEALEAATTLDAARLLIVDDLTHFTPELGALLARSLRKKTLVAAGTATQAACEALGGRFVLVGRLDVSSRRELLRRRLEALGAPLHVPDHLPFSGFEIDGLARTIALTVELGAAN